jgi:Terminase large subunit, T4likevirus-type, N-terminal
MPLGAGLLDACDDPQLLGAVKLWPRQRLLCEAIDEGARLSAWRLGRRSGKTTLGALIGVWDATLRPHVDRHLRPGEKRYAVSVATSERQARIFIRQALAIVERSPMLSRLVQRVSDDEIEFERVILRALPATARGVRGLPTSSIFVDEAAHMLDLDGDSSAGPMFRSLVPGSYQFADDAVIVVSSTPLDASGWFYDVVQQVESGEVEDAHAFHFAAPEVNPTLKPELLRAELERDPAAYECEVLANWATAGLAFIDPRRLADVVVDRGELGRLDAAQWILGFDAAYVSDPAAAVLVGQDTANERLLVGAVRVWEPQRAASYEQRREREDSLLEDVAALGRAYDAMVVVDQFQAQPIRDRLARLDVPVKTVPLSATLKTEMFNELRNRIYVGEIELPRDERLLRELRGLKSQFKAGRAGVTTPRARGAHSDTAVALALACWQQRHVGAGDLHAAFHREGRFDAEPGTLAAYLREDERSGQAPLSRDMRL